MEIWLLKELQLWLRCLHGPGKEPEPEARLGRQEGAGWHFSPRRMPMARGCPAHCSLDPARAAGYPGVAAGPSVCRGGGEGHWDSEGPPPVGHLVLFHLFPEKNHNAEIVRTSQ